MRLGLCFILNVLFFVHFSSGAVVVKEDGELRFYEQPSDTYLTKSQPAILKCVIENARNAFFKCNDKWEEEQGGSSKIIQIGNKQYLSVEITITKSQLDEYKKSLLASNSESISQYWCTCQAWLNGDDDTIISRRAYVKLAFIEPTFEWEPMPTSGLIGKSVEIRCLAPDGDPKPIVQWLKNGAPIDKTNKRILVSHEGSLLINEVRSTDAANYTCVADNFAGRRISDAAALVVVENKGWSEWSNWTECESVSGCGEGVQRRTRTCLNPPTINNAIGCDGFPQQSITCYIPCPVESELKNPVKNVEAEMNKKTAASLKTSLDTPETAFVWSHWTSWTMVCNSDCLRTRRRECKFGQLSSSGKFVMINKPSLVANQCPGTDLEYSNCSFYCEPIRVTVTMDSSKPKESTFMSQYVSLALVILAVAVVFLVVCVFFKFKLRKTRPDRKNGKVLSNDHNPIYYSVQPDYMQDAYMDVCTLLPQHQNAAPVNFMGKSLAEMGLMANIEYLNAKTAVVSGMSCGGGGGQCGASTLSEDRCDASRNSTTTTTSGTNSTTSSKIKLNTSPTDSLVKNHCQPTLLPSCQCCVGNSTANAETFSLDDYENNAYQISKLINERKTCICPPKSILKKVPNGNELLNCDLYSFNLFKSGGFVDIPKYSCHALIPDETIVNDVSVGIVKNSNSNLFQLKGEQTLLSSIYAFKSENYSNFVKPIIISVDHAAQFVESDWTTTIYFKSFNSFNFEEINEQTDPYLYSHVVANKCYVMSEKEGMFALVGRPKSSSMIACVKEMKYAILLGDKVVKVYLLANTRAATEIVNEVILKSNGKIIKMPDLFELQCPKKLDAEATMLNFEVNIEYHNQLSNSDSTCRQIKLVDIWNSSADFTEIEFPFAIIGNNHKTNDASNGKFNFDLNVNLKLENRLVFSYSNTNTNTSDLHTANCSQQEFYSSVSVNPVFIPLKITNLLDEYVIRCFKMNTLKRNDWRLFANLLKCDRNDQYFSNKENSFELIISLWLLINLSRSDTCSLTSNLVNK